MGHREVKRVPMDFDAPMKKVWEGYINPWYEFCQTCQKCAGSGYNPATKQLADDWYDHDGFGVTWSYDYGIGRDGKPAERPPWRIIGESRAWQHAITQDEVQALVDAGRLMDFTRTPRNAEQEAVVREKIANGGNSWLPYDNGYVPTADEVNEWSHHGFGHDCTNRHICVETRAKRLGVYGLCPICEGEGSVWLREGAKEKADAWTETEPPTGDGWQLWETTSEGSPMSPVFARPEDLAEWCETGATIFGSETMTKAQWLRYICEDDMAIGSVMVATDGYVGSIANEPVS